MSKSLIDVVHQIDWMLIHNETGHHRNMVPRDRVAVAFEVSTRKGYEGRNNSVRIRIGSQLLETLGWKTGDRIYIAVNPDDNYIFKCFKAESAGFKLLCPVNSKNGGSITFTWKECPLGNELQKLMEVKHLVHDGQLLFRTKPESIPTPVNNVTKF